MPTIRAASRPSRSVIKAAAVIRVSPPSDILDLFCEECTNPGGRIQAPGVHNRMHCHEAPDFTSIKPARLSAGGRCSTLGDMSDASDAELVLRTRSGEVQTFGELVRRYQDSVFNVCYRLAGGGGEAEGL